MDPEVLGYFWVEKREKLRSALTSKRRSASLEGPASSIGACGQKHTNNKQVFMIWAKKGTGHLLGSD